MKIVDLTLVYLIKDTKVLLALKKRGFGTGKYNGAGGKVEKNETIEEAMVRETYEEIGVKPEKYKKVGCLKFNEFHENERKIMNLHIYTCTSWSGEITESEEMKPEWFDINNLPLRNMWEADSIWLSIVLAGKKIVGKFRLNEDGSVNNYFIKEIDNLPENYQSKFAVFDIDGTLIRWQLYHAVVDRLAEEGYLGVNANQTLKNARMKWKKREHSDSFSKYEKYLIELYESALTAIEPAVFDQIVDDVASEYKEQVYTYTRDLIHDLKKQGYTILAISGSHQELVNHIAEHYGFDDYVGTYYERKDNTFSGKKNIASHNKQVILKDLIDKHDLTLKDSYAVGDSLSDSVMLEMVDKPIAFNPDQSLLQKAKMNNWKIVVERKNVIYELDPKDGKYILA